MQAWDMHKSTQTQSHNHGGQAYEKVTVCRN